MKTKSDPRHPDDLIFDIKLFIYNLSKTQYWQFEKLIEELNLNKLGEDWMFDYVFNDSNDETFEKYLIRHNRTLDEMIKIEI